MGQPAAEAFHFKLVHQGRSIIQMPGHSFAEGKASSVRKTSSKGRVSWRLFRQEIT